MSDATDKQALLQGYKPTRAERAYAAVTDWRYILAGLGILTLVLDHFGFIDIPEFSTLQKLLVVGFVGGYIGAKIVVWPVIKDRITPDMVQVELAPVEGQLNDTLHIPTDDFWKFEVLGGHLVEKRTLTGGIRFVVRGIDTGRRLLVPAGDRPSDEEIPDDLNLIGSGADTMYHKLKGPMLEEYRAATDRARDKEVMFEEAKRQVQNEVAELFEDIRAGKLNVESESDRREAEDRVEGVIRRLAIKSYEADEAGDGE
jgi:hypothetical protein